MKRLALGLTAIALAALTSACGYTEHTYAVQGPAPAYVQAPAPSYERPVAVPGATYYGDRAYDYPAPRTSYVYSGY
jgi:hypothetical protein